MTDSDIDGVIKSAARIIIEPVLSLLQEDPHQWSTRPCGTCKAISAIVGKPFGCYEYKRRKEQK